MEEAKMSEKPIKASCHCGDIVLTAPHKPKELNECQCTICYRYGAVWAYYSTNGIKFDNRPDASTKKYIWGIYALFNIDRKNDIGVIFFTKFGVP